MKRNAFANSLNLTETIVSASFSLYVRAATIQTKPEMLRAVNFHHLKVILLWHIGVSL